MALRLRLSRVSWNSSEYGLHVAFGRALIGIPALERDPQRFDAAQAASRVPVEHVRHRFVAEQALATRGLDHDFQVIRRRPKRREVEDRELWPRQRDAVEHPHVVWQNSTTLVHHETAATRATPPWTCQLDQIA